MDSRFFLWVAVGLLWLFVYQTWLMEKAPRPTPEAVTEQAPADSSIPQLPAGDSLPTLPESATPAPTVGPQVPVAEASPVVQVRTDVYTLSIDTRGARLVDVVMNDYPKQKDRPDDLVTLLEDDPTRALLQLQAGMLAPAGVSAPNHEARYTAAQMSYALSDGQDELVVPLSWRNAEGVTATKTFRFYRGRYNIDVDLDVSNGSGESWSAAPYQQIQRRQVAPKRSFVDVDSYSFTGPVFYDGNAAEKYKPKKLRKEPIDLLVRGGWIASIQHHFLAAAIPDPAPTVQYRSRVSDAGMEFISAVSPLATLAPGGSQSFRHTFFVGPKYQEQLAETAPGLVRTVDYGVLSILSQPLFWLLQKIHSLTGNWGWAIIIMTILIKIVFYPLAEKSGRSMAKMRKLAPRMKALQDRYKDDRQALSKAMMEMYKREKVNPMSSCLPLLVQMPVFLALYWVLIESVELRQAPFALWIDDLSSRDPFFVLPLIMAGAMYVQTKLNPPPADPTTAKVMTIMPIMMSVFFAFFPAGLVLYWVVNTILSVLQQWRINRVVEAAG